MNQYFAILRRMAWNILKIFIFFLILMGLMIYAPKVLVGLVTLCAFVLCLWTIWDIAEEEELFADQLRKDAKKKSEK